MGTIEVHDSVGAIEAASWSALVAGAEPDVTQGYLLFRERLEPGDPLLVTASDGDGLTAAVHAVRAVADSGLFSHPWRLLTDEQFLRLDGGDASRVHDEHRSLLTELGCDGTPASLASVAGDPLVVRTFDRSPVMTTDRGDVQEIVAALREQADTVVLPYVEDDAAALADALRDNGFVRGSVTGASVLDVADFASYHDFLDAHDSRTRRHYRLASRELTNVGLTVREVPLAGHVDRIVDLETRTGARNGARPDPERLRAARTYLAEVLPDAHRVAVAGRTVDDILACTVQLYGPQGCCLLAYGCDYDVTGTSLAYHHLVFGEPVEACIRAGVPRYRLGFEAFSPKSRRGARVSKRHFWLWTADDGLREKFARLLSFMDGRTTGYLAQFH